MCVATLVTTPSSYVHSVCSGYSGNTNFTDFVSTLKYNYKIIKIDLYGFGKSPLPNFIDNIYDYLKIQKYIAYHINENNLIRFLKYS